MYFILDIAIVLIICGLAIRYAGSSFWSPLLRGIAVLVASAIAVTASAFIAPVLSDSLVGPAVEKYVSFELSDMVSGEHLASAKATTDKLDKRLIEKIVEEKTKPFVRWTKKYNSSEEEVIKSYQKNKNALDMVKTVADPLAITISEALIYIVLWILAYVLLLLLVVKRFEGNMISTQRKKKSIKNIWGPIVGALCGVAVVLSVSVLLEWLVDAFCGMTIVLSKDVVTKGVIYPLLKFINPILLLLGILP